jgi:hypothetical protein
MINYALGSMQIGNVIDDLLKEFSVKVENIELMEYFESKYIIYVYFSAKKSEKEDWPDYLINISKIFKILKNYKDFSKIRIVEIEDGGRSNYYTFTIAISSTTVEWGKVESHNSEVK